MWVAKSLWRLWKCETSFSFLCGPGQQIVLTLNPHFSWPVSTTMKFFATEGLSLSPLNLTCLELPGLRLGGGGVHRDSLQSPEMSWLPVLSPPHTNTMDWSTFGILRVSFASLVGWFVFPCPLPLGRGRGGGAVGESGEKHLFLKYWQNCMETE